MHKKVTLSNILISFIFTLLFISLAVVVTINFRPLYYLDIKALNIEQQSGYSTEEIRSNYDALIDYSSPFFQKELNFPTLPSSEAGIQHFVEVKNIFTAFYIMGAITLALGICIIVYKEKKKDTSYLFMSSITAIVLPLIVGALVAIDFDRAFVLFHQLFFRNDYWIFDPVTDPIIQMLPAEFFLHCALFIIGIVILFSGIFMGCYLFKKKRFTIKNRKGKPLKF